MTTRLQPQTSSELQAMLAEAARRRTSLEIRAGASKLSWGGVVRADNILDMNAFSGIDLYQPEELVMTAGAATPLMKIDALLREQSQQLAFEPANFSRLLGATDSATIGGVFSCNLSGPRRIKIGAARDHLLGFSAVNGVGEPFKSGGRVVKNVSGFDLCKLMSGAFGTLGAIERVSFKVLAKAEKTRTVLLFGLDDRDGARAMTMGLNSPHEISAAMHLPEDVAALSSVSYVRGAGRAVTALRLEGPGPSVEKRCADVRALLHLFGGGEELHSANSAELWREVRDVLFYCDDNSQVWRISVPPAQGAVVGAALLRATEGRVFYDWGGGLLWLSHAPVDDAHHEIVRRTVGDLGHATLIRADAAVRARTPVFQPQPTALATLAHRVRDAFDPEGILNPGRMD
ncbi:FAD-binding protein [Varunaivibrio sulfuroxidans]|uniref:Glycolate oxidase FAD binding subunit n=1 Tax=Varunaivibrio sulfuroxidans TaxID=1773489 RepID=A0A4R3J8U0_9PROT|nr:FAD-binding protein [Varunaivibrio sulfuroxidans]TCS60960.1 glycolate oxidase FAD binding subunit [Varunaivibrio sulfuroxidans]WES31634.1 FAD-binding protein [Varunaivibrio sulfuroxidans]